MLYYAPFPRRRGHDNKDKTKKDKDNESEKVHRTVKEDGGGT